jgi:hypothetical protein
MKAIVNKAVCMLYTRPTRESSLTDEVLYGMVVELLEQPAPGWYRVRTHYRYEGFAPAEDLLTENTEVWEQQPKLMVRNKNNCDVLSEAKVQGYPMQNLPRGGLVIPEGEENDGWQKVRLAAGRTGFLPSSIVVPQPLEPVSREEAELRKALVDTAMLYQGTHYRWGGKSPQGIDCSGLCSMAYMLCGILIYRDAKLKEGFPIHEISPEEIRPGDLLYFPGHIAMYIGDGKYCHATAKAGCNGFVINSLNPDDPDYREDLRSTITAVGSYFCRSGA